MTIDLRFILSSSIVLALLLAACTGAPILAPAAIPTAPPNEESTETDAATDAGRADNAESVAGPADTQNGQTVQIDAGLVAGTMTGGVLSFKGIPYAAPPVGDLRWREPQPVKPWEGVLEASAFRNDCMQAPGDFEPIQTTPAEDCLYLNVWRPAASEPNPEGSARLPVLVWIHGGGYVGGGSSIPYYDGTSFARQGMVVVTFNYRLGRFGFFAHPALLAAGEGPVGNFGYMDQIQALEWVQTNIESFGGDPARVTLMGQSAGGASVLHLLTSPVTEGLFHQVMVLSGGGRKALSNRPMTGGARGQPSVDQIDASFAQGLGIEGADAAALAALRALPPDVLAAELTLDNLLQAALLGLPTAGSAMIDGTIVVGEPGDLIKSGAAPDVPIIIGTTALDLPLYFPPSKIDPFAFFGDEADAARVAYNATGTLDQQAFLLTLLSISTDITMHEPARFVAREMTAAGNPAWLYRFTYTAQSTRPEATGQGHAGELPFLFNTLAAKFGEKVTEQDQLMADAFHAYAANFIKNGDPNGERLPAWPPFGPEQTELMHFTLDDGPVFEPEPRPGLFLVERAVDAAAAEQ
jgi:para-nitrobenzyl esterase